MHKTRQKIAPIGIFVFMLALSSLSPTVLAYKSDTVSPYVGTTLSGQKCDADQIPFGPYDYLQRANHPYEIEVVESAHFDLDVESLKKGRTSTPINDIQYTLSAWPNHHRALNSALKYRLQHMEEWPEDSSASPAECLLQRAINFSPNDPKPYIMYALLLHKVGQYDKALAAYQTAIRLLPDDIITQYNMGLTLVELKKYSDAEKVATKVYAAGFPLPGLKRKLIAAGYLKDAPGAAPPEATPQADAPKATKIALPDTTVSLGEVEKKTAIPEKAAP